MLNQMIHKLIKFYLYQRQIIISMFLLRKEWKAHIIILCFYRELGWLTQDPKMTFRANARPKMTFGTNAGPKNNY